MRQSASSLDSLVPGIGSPGADFVRAGMRVASATWVRAVALALRGSFVRAMFAPEVSMSGAGKTKRGQILICAHAASQAWQ